ncbi:MAG: hypothetical protein AAF573_15530 [Bacteroidota bacterium]
MKNYILILATFLFFSCGGDQAASSSSGAKSANLTGYSIVDFPNSNMQKAMRTDAAGKIVEEGEVLDGKKTGTWITYHDGENIIVSTITNYVNGMRNGLWMRVGKNNRVEAYGYYANDVKDGKWVTYNFSRREKEEEYRNGKLHGISRTFYKTGKDGQIKEELEYKDGVQDGIYRYYLEDGSISLDYVYKNGEVIERKKQG